MKKLATLERVDLREVWKNEATEFTPWLAQQENIERLSNTLKIDLEVIGQEERIGPFRADILCKDINTGKYVIIKNQLERTDHSHLGQILTYSAGTNAYTHIWISESFTEEHRAAFDWLNEITISDFNFFGVEMQLFKIGDSDIAPYFNIVSQPNDWSKITRKTISTDISDNEIFRKEYWTALNEYFLTKGKQVFKTDYKPSINHWMNFAIGKSGIYLSTDLLRKYNELRVSLFFNNKDDFDKMFEICGNESAELFNLTWEKSDEKQSARTFVSKNFDINNRENWNEQHEWIRENLDKLFRYFAPKIKSLK